MRYPIRFTLLALILLSLACDIGSGAAESRVVPTKTPLPTFTPTPTFTLPPPPTETPPPTATATTVVVAPTSPPTETAVPPPPTEAPTTVPLLTDNPLPPALTATPLPTATPTATPAPEPVIKYVLGATQREFNCEATYIFGVVQNANNFGVPNVQVRALGIHETSGLDFTVQTDAEGRYEIFRIPLNDLLAAQWAVMLMEDGREVSERFHWASTPVCQSDDLGHSQVLRVDWKLIE